MTLRFWLLCCLLPLSLMLSAQTWNPFDIKNRNAEEVSRAMSGEAANDVAAPKTKVDSADPYAIISSAKQSDPPTDNIYEEVKVNYTDSLTILGNPYEIIRINRQPNSFTDTPSVSEVNQSVESFVFVLQLVILLLLAILMSIYRDVMPQITKAILNNNYMKLMYRSANESIVFRLKVFYVFFFLNGGLFLFQSAGKFGLDLENLGWNGPTLLIILTIGVAGFFLVKHGIMAYLATFFPPRKELSLVSFMIMIFNIWIGLFLVPINLILAFGTEEMAGLFFIIAIIIVAISLVINHLKAMVIGANVWMNNVFHFFLYLCAVEIAPVLILWKFTQSVG
jgi:hypothetical protein